MRELWRCIFLLLMLSSCASAVRLERDDTGRSVAVPDRVHRVVSLAPNITNTVYALGAESDLVGITNFTFYPPEAARQKPSVGEVIQPSLEKIVALHPDLVLALPPFNSAETIEGLQRLGLTVFLINSSDLSHIYQMIATVGRLLGRDRESANLLAELHARESSIRAQSGRKDRPSVLLVVSIDPLITAGKNAFITEMISAAGARSVTEDLSPDWLQVSIESILPKRSDYILLMKGGPVRLQEMQQRAGWSSLEAVRQGRIIFIDDRIQLPSPVAFDGLEDLARQVHAMQPH